MVFTASKAGPWFLSPEQQALQRYDQPTGKTKNVEKSKKLLHEALLERGRVTLQQNQGHTKKELQDIARNKSGIELYDLKEVITSGWDTFYSLNFRNYVLSVVRFLVLVFTRYLVSFHHDRTSRFPGPRPLDRH
jgi:hypothetical protein